MGDIDRTWTWGPLYMDICGTFGRQIDIGITVSWSNEPFDSWGKRISLRLLFWCVTIGWGD